MSKTPVRVAVTGAAGQIGYALLFRIASGEMLGKDQPVILQLLEVPVDGPQKALKGVMMELDDCAFPLLVEMTAHSDPMTAFKDADYALLVGSRPRGPGMERAELLAVNGAIFTAQGKALNAVASRNVKVLVVGNPANTNAYIAMKSAPDLPRKNFTAMLRLDHNRAASQIAAKTGKAVKDIKKLTVWGNHSPTMYADYRFATIKGESVAKMINDQEWNANTFLPTVGKRGAAIIEARGLSSAASHPFRWPIRHSEGRHVRLPGHLRERRIQDCRRPGHRRLQPGTHRKNAQGTDRRASRRRSSSVKRTGKCSIRATFCRGRRPLQRPFRCAITTVARPIGCKKACNCRPQ